MFFIIIKNLYVKEILDKYKERVDSLRNEVKCIMHEEYEERQMSRTEEFVEKTEKMIKTDIKTIVKNKEEKKRDWFQTQQERQDSKSNNIYIILLSFELFKIIIYIIMYF